MLDYSLDFRMARTLQGRPYMNTNEIEIGMRVRTVGLSDEDSDAGWVYEILDEETVLVGWDSGVRTPCAAASLAAE